MRKNPFTFEFNSAGFRSLEVRHFVICYNPKEKNPRKLKFLCCVCSKLIDGYDECLKHCNSNRKHYDDVCKRRRRLMSVSKCRLCQNHESLSYLTEFLQSNISKFGPLKEKDRKKRLKVHDTLVGLLEDAGLKGIDVNVFGSSVTLLGFKDADVNIALSVKNYKDLNPDFRITDSFSLLWFTADVIKKSGLFNHVKQQPELFNPQCVFKDKSGINYVIKLQSDHHLQSHDLIMKYQAIDERVGQLIMVLKLWAQTIGVCDTDGGGIPAFNLILMVLYYLQQVKPPVTPIIKIENTEGLSKDIVLDPDREKNNVLSGDELSTWKSRNNSNLGELWLGFLRFYVGEFSRKALVINVRQMTPLSRIHKECSSRRFALEDPFNLKENNISRNSAGSVAGFFMDSLNISYRYFTQCSHKEGDNDSNEDNGKKAKSRVSKQGDGETQHDDESEKTPAEKIVKQEDNPSHDSNDDNDDDVIIESDSDIDESDATTTDGSDVKKTSTTTSTTDEQQLTDDTDNDYIKITSSNKEESFVDVTKEIPSADLEKSTSMNDNDKVHAIADAMKESDSSTETSEKDSVEESGESVHDIQETPPSSSSDDGGDERKIEIDCEKQTPESPMNSSNEMKEKSNKAKYNILEFDKKFFGPKKPVPMFCQECKQDGHVRSKCPSAKVKVDPLPPMTKEFMDTVDRVCLHLIRKKELKSQEFDQRMAILKDIEYHLKVHYREDCVLKLFGSSVNGFGFSGSDMDVCLQFQTAEAPKNIQPVEVIKKVQKALEKNPNCRKVYSIKTAKVPIVKFNVSLGGKEVDVDISFYNTLALHNSNMLAAYASLDSRVRTLGYCLKIFAKTCNIGDASRASLSSYAYILLLLYYLQNCNPPVVPVLQEMYDKKSGKPKRMIEGWNTWFFQDIPSLAKVWPGLHKNTETAGELFVGFFRFYTEKFDFSKQVVAMKQSEPLYKHKKSWNGAVIAIEDPFLLTHNLGGGIQKNMFHFIMECFVSARSHFGDCTRSLPSSNNDAVLCDNFFNETLIVGGKKLPQNRLCRRCNRIGHVAAHCAEKEAIERDRVRTKSESEAAKASDNNDAHKRTDQDSKGRRNRRNRNREEVASTCFYCHETGHFKVDCPVKKKDKMNELKHKERSVRTPDSARKQNNAQLTPMTPTNQKISASTSFSSALQMSAEEINRFFKENMQKNQNSVFPANTQFQPPLGLPIVPNAPQFLQKSNDFKFDDFAVCFQQLNQQQRQQQAKHSPQQLQHQTISQNSPRQRQQTAQAQQVPLHRQLVNQDQLIQRQLQMMALQQQPASKQALFEFRSNAEEAAKLNLHQSLEKRLNQADIRGGLYDDEFPQMSGKQLPIGIRPSSNSPAVGSSHKPNKSRSAEHRNQSHSRR